MSDNAENINNENGPHYVVTNNVNNMRSIDPDLCELLTRKQPRFIPAAPKCANCNKSVYKAEEIRAANKIFHKFCFKCTCCNKLLETNILTEHQGDLFCRNCYAKQFGPKGVGFGTTTLSSENSTYQSLQHQQNHSQEENKTESVKHVQINPVLRSTFSTLNHNNIQNTNGHHTSPTNGSYQMSALNYEKRSSTCNMTFGGSDKCARCTKPVYAAEKVFAAGKPFHKLCFSCSTCKKLLSSMNCCDNSESEIFCKGCYGKQYGPKGIGFGVGAGALQPG